MMDTLFVQTVYTSLGATYFFPLLWRYLTPVRTWAIISLAAAAYFAYMLPILAARFPLWEATLRSLVMTAIPLVGGPIVYYVYRRSIWKDVK